MKRYAFIDVQNTETTTLKVLGFEVDHQKLYLYLKERWFCEKVFFYPGTEYGDVERENIFKKISEIGGIVRPKYYYKYKNKDKLNVVSCPQCNTQFSNKVDMGYTWKCNCDVEMTIDILEHCRENAELLIFTGDGDFGSLVEKAAIDKSKVFLISNMQKTYNNLTNSRFAKKLKLLVEKYPEKVIYVDINDWKMRVKKDFKQNENAVQAGGFE